MILNKRYDEVMERIEVTDAMRRRILANLDKMDLTAAPRFKAAHSPAIKRLIPLAACFALLLVGIFSIRHFMPGEATDPPGSVMVANDIVEVADADALSEAVRFPVKELLALPFQTEKVTYLSFWRELAEITYTGEGQTITFRQSAGEGDNSGDYNVYAITEVKEIDGLSVTLKGNGQTSFLAVWSDGTYAYSISAESGLTVSELEAIISSMK